MNSPDFDACAAGLRKLFRMPEPSQPKAEALRLQLAELPDALAAITSEAARAPTAEKLETLAIRLQGAARLALSLREAMQREATN